jgi:hypothetical protein
LFERSPNRPAGQFRHSTAPKLHVLRSRWDLVASQRIIPDNPPTSHARQRFGARMDRTPPWRNFIN